ncbi:ABC transporter ATP-binding protein [Clostridium perfringens]|uniref:ABC transporter ATP-binding protein n=1 Tax=Clostridium perfringens TaxID=1502 RepID=UPI0024BCD736|nr:ABC transporter ATP-binding protein [Clostridium perfringens]ELC8463952.1 ABC transporter ATP-binding protein [Clostridium perfringens]
MKRYFIYYKKKLFLTMICICIQSIVSVVIAFVFKNIIDFAQAGDLNNFKISLIILFIISILNYLISIIVGISKSSLIKSIMVKLKEELIERIICNERYINEKESSGKLISNIINDVPILENSYFYSIINIFSAGVNFIFGVWALLYINYIIGLIVIVSSVLLSYLPNFTKLKLAKLKDTYSQWLIKLTSKIKETLSGLDTIKIFNSEKQFLKILNLSVEESEKAKYKFNCFYVFSNSTFSFLGFVISILTISASAYLVIKGQITMGVMIAAVQLINNINSPLQLIISSKNNLNSSNNVKENIELILEQNIQQNKSINNDMKFIQGIEMKNVSYYYDNELFKMDNINLSINKGDKIVIVGPSGSGKSTLLKLISGELKSKDGLIKIDDKDISSISKNNLGKVISVISQDIFIFNTTVKNNITLYNEIKEENIEYWINKLGMKSLINNYTEYLNTNIYENGYNISGGQKQQICILRALVRNTPILVLDEMNSSLDNNLSFKIENELLDNEEITLISVTHKLNKKILSKYDKIVYMENGRICELGEFNQLISEKKKFFDLYNIQK